MSFMKFYKYEMDGREDEEEEEVGTVGSKHKSVSSECETRWEL
jgi:hypothetical protein